MSNNLIDSRPLEFYPDENITSGYIVLDQCLCDANSFEWSLRKWNQYPGRFYEDHSGSLEGAFYFSPVHPAFVLPFAMNLEEIHVYKVECKQSRTNFVNHMYNIYGLCYTKEAKIIRKIERDEITNYAISDVKNNDKNRITDNVSKWMAALETLPEKSLTEIVDKIWENIQPGESRYTVPEFLKTSTYIIRLTAKGKDSASAWKNRLLKAYLRPGEKSSTSLDVNCIQWILDHHFMMAKYKKCNFYKEKGFDEMAFNIFSEKETKMLLALIGDDLKEIAKINFNVNDVFQTDCETITGAAWDCSYDYDEITHTIYVNFENLQKHIEILEFIQRQIQTVANQALRKKWVFAIMGY